MTNVIETVNLTKKYGNFAAVDQANFTLKKGEILGLIGKNGAGKTTLLKMIMGLSHPTSGTVSIYNQQSEAQLNVIRSNIGFMIEPNFYPYLNAEKNLEITSRLKGINSKQEIKDVLKLVDLDGVKKPFKNYSMGMRQRLGVANALLGHPDIIVLDEPINGLDPQGIADFRKTIKEIAKERGITFLISSHILAELDLMANRFCFIDKGRILETISHEELMRKNQNTLEVVTDDVNKTVAILEEELDITKYQVIENNVLLLFEYIDQPEIVSQTIFENDIKLKKLTVNHAKLEDYFLGLINGGSNV